MDCRQQVRVDAGPTAAVQPEAIEPVGDLLRPAAEVWRPSPSQRPPDKYEALRLAGISAWRAVNDCDLLALKNAILSRTEFVSVAAETPPDENSYEKMVNGWVARVEREFCTPPPEETHRIVGEAEIKDFLLVPVGRLWKRPVGIGVVTAYVFPPGDFRRREERRTPPLIFLDFEGSWRILVKK